MEPRARVFVHRRVGLNVPRFLLFDFCAQARGFLMFVRVFLPPYLEWVPPAAVVQCVAVGVLQR